MLSFYHFNFNVLDLDRSISFYKDYFNLHTDKESSSSDGSFKLVFLKDSDGSPFSLELTWLRDRTEPYDLGEQEFHLAFLTDDYEALHKLHSEAGIICFENPAMGIYFVEDPDGYWIEIVPVRK